MSHAIRAPTTLPDMFNEIEKLAQRRAELTDQLETVTKQLAQASTDAVLAGKPPTLVAAWANVPRMTLARWIKDREGNTK